jgi:hypothetical protein
MDGGVTPIFSVILFAMGLDGDDERDSSKKPIAKRRLHSDHHHRYGLCQKKSGRAI